MDVLGPDKIKVTRMGTGEFSGDWTESHVKVVINANYPGCSSVYRGAFRR